MEQFNQVTGNIIQSNRLHIGECITVIHSIRLHDRKWFVPLGDTIGNNVIHSTNSIRLHDRKPTSFNHHVTGNVLDLYDSQKMHFIPLDYILGNVLQ